MKNFLFSQFKNIFLWTPFLIAAGAAFYFSLSFEPNIQHPFLIGILFGILSVVLWRKNPLYAFIPILCFGFFYAMGFTHLKNTPGLKYTLRNTEIIGTVSKIDYMPENARVHLKSDIGNVRLTVKESIPKIGDTIIATGTLFRPDGPYAPGTFDYSAWAYFNNLTATGYMTDFKITSHGKPSNINSLRDYIHSKTNSFLSDTLVLGYKNAVPKQQNQIWTATGVGHVWSISGFHMTIVGGWLFIIFYFIFRLFPKITRQIPARIPALICAWIGLLFYLFLSGLDVATIRAFGMTSLIFLAFIVGRGAFSLRNVALVFIALFLLNPHYIMQPGFQLSFAAIFGLIWYFGEKKYEKISGMRRILRIIKMTILTSVIATIFTAPFVAYHFYSLPIYSLVGNLILLPVFSFAIMPLVIIGTITALFGWTVPLIGAEFIYNWIFSIAQSISELPFATIQIPHVLGMALGCMIFGLLCLMFINARRANYIIGTIFFTIGIVTVIITPRPIFYSVYNNELIGYVENDKLKFNRARASNHYFAFSTWKQLNGEPTDTPNETFPCRGGFCKIQTHNLNIAYVQKFTKLYKNIGELCRDKDLDFIVSYFKIDAPNCHAKTLRGGFVIYESGRVKYTPSARRWN